MVYPDQNILQLFWSVALLALQIVVVSRSVQITAERLVMFFAPVLLYAFYIIYTAELLRNMNDEEKGFSWFIGKRLLGFGIVSGIILIFILNIFQQNFKTIEQDWGGGNGGNKLKGNKESMTKERKDGSISNKDQMKVTGSLEKDKRLVFVAHLDNFFPDGQTPNPLYFTSRYYTKFDTATQTFETDAKMPYNDLFSPNPSRIPLFFAKTDSSVIRNTNAPLARKVVSTDVYKVILSPDEFIAPSTAFFVQPIPVEKEYKDQFKSAYRAKMWVSDLNSAFFIYNPAGNPALEEFQQQRFENLRQASSYQGIDKAFMNYYTFMPQDQEYDRIRNLALEITKNAKTPVDKMIAIRNYFTSKDAFGQPLYKYSDNPGVPGLPSANKLNYFLFENKKGYCAYYAGATLFLLRSLGIPSRIAAGFLTVDRSNKNPGWYWFYADQAHAWVQLYFKGFGWIDFDTTVPDVNTQESPQPDGTPPLNTQKAYLVADGEAISVDTVSKLIAMRVKKMLYHDENFTSEQTSELLLNVSIASVTRDTGTVRLSDVRVGNKIVAVSYAQELKNLPPSPMESMGKIIAKLPNPVPIDEIKIMETDEQKSIRQQQSNLAKKPFNWMQALFITLIIILGALLLLLATPFIIWQYYNLKVRSKKSTKKKAYDIYTASLFYLNQLGINRMGVSPEQFATTIDVNFKTNYSSFMRAYQKLKYSTAPLTEKEVQTIRYFFATFKQKVRAQIPLKTRIIRFLNIQHTIQFFSKPKMS